MMHKELVELVAKVWNDLDAGIVAPFISKDFEYESFWVFETLKGKEQYLDYLTGKFKAIKRTGSKVVAKNVSKIELTNMLLFLLKMIERGLCRYGYIMV